MSIAAAAVGGGLGLIGGLLGGSGAASAGRQQAALTREALQAQQQAALEQRFYQLVGLYGDQAPQVARQLLSRDDYETLFGVPATTARDLSNDEQRRVRDIDAQISNLERSQPANRAVGLGTGVGSQRRTNPNQAEIDRLRGERDAITGGAGGTAGRAGMFNTDQFTTGQRGALADYEGIQQDFYQQGLGLMGSYDQDTLNLRDQQREIERLAGLGVDDVVSGLRRSGEESLNIANNQAIAQLAARGLGNSTLVGNQISTNARNIGNDVNDRIAAINLDRNNRLAQLRSQGLSLNASRAGGRTGIQASLQDRDLGLRRAPIDLRASTLMGSGFNAQTGINNAAFIPQQTGAGAMSQSLGNTLAGYGGLFAGGAFNSLFSQQQQPTAANTKLMARAN